MANKENAEHVFLRSATVPTALACAIKEALEGRAQWKRYTDTDPETFLRYHHRLEAYVELLEVYDCGSVGGFGDRQRTGQNLIRRAKWLIAKYGASAC